MSGYIVQRYTESNAVAYRNSTWLRSRNAGVWTSWQRIDNYGTTSLAGLASLLGVAENPATLKFEKSQATSKYIVIDLPAGYYPGRIDFYGFIPTFSAVISFSQTTSSIETYGKVLAGGFGTQKVYKDTRHIVIEMNAANSVICGMLMSSKYVGVAISYASTYDVSGMTEITFS